MKDNKIDKQYNQPDPKNTDGIKNYDGLTHGLNIKP